MNLPGVISTRVYSLFDPTNKGYVTKESFMTTCQRLLSLEAEQKIRLVFDLLDFNTDGVIEKDEIWTLLCHLPLQKTVQFTLLTLFIEYKEN